MVITRRGTKVPCSSLQVAYSEFTLSRGLSSTRFELAYLKSLTCAHRRCSARVLRSNCFLLREFARTFTAPCVCGAGMVTIYKRLGEGHTGRFYPKDHACTLGISHPSLSAEELCARAQQLFGAVKADRGHVLHSLLIPPRFYSLTPCSRILLPDENNRSFIGFACMLYKSAIY